MAPGRGTEGDGAVGGVGVGLRDEHQVDGLASCEEQEGGLGAVAGAPGAACTRSGGFKPPPGLSCVRRTRVSVPLPRPRYLQRNFKYRGVGCVQADLLLGSERIEEASVGG